MFDTRTSFTYDPSRQGYDTNSWRTISGTPVIVGGRLSVDSGAGSGATIHYADFLKGDVSFNVNVPVSPGVDSARYFGLSTARQTQYIRFAITDHLHCETASNAATTVSDALTWDDSGWNDTNIEFRIIWVAGGARFLINGTQVYQIYDESVPYGPLSLFISDESGSALTVGEIIVRETQSYVMNPVTSDTTNFGAGDLKMSQSVTITENIVLLTPVPSLSPSISPSKSPSLSPSLSPSVSPSASLSPSLSPSVSPSASLSPSISPSVSPSASLSPSLSPSVSPSASLSPSISPSLSSSISPSLSPSLSPSISPSVSPSASLSPSLSPSISPSLSPSTSPSASLSPSVSPSYSPSNN